MLRSIRLSPPRRFLARLMPSLLIASLAFGAVSSASAQDSPAQSNAPTIDEEFLSIACVYIENGDYNRFNAFLADFELAIEDYYQAINCELVDYPGVTIMHTTLETNLGLLGFTSRILRDIERAKEGQPELRTAVFFNQCRNGKSVLDLLIEYKWVSRNNPRILAKLEEVETQIESLGALPCPERFKNTRTTSTGIPF